VVQAALFGGLFIGILSALPIIQYANCCCIWIIGGGLVAAYLDQQNDSRPITAGRGALAGLLAGLVGAVVWLVAALLLRAMLAPLRERFAGAVLRSAPDMPPEVRTIFENAGASSVAEYVAFFVLFVFAGSIVSTVGGLLGAAFFRNDVPPALGGTPPPLPPET